MSLSVCLVATDSAPRAATILESLRPYADEVLIAADSHVAEETLSCYSKLADRLLRIDSCSDERHTDLPHEQCGGDWILRLSGDELASRAFLRRLPEMLSSRTVQRFWVLRRWLFGDEKRYIAEQPWSADFVNRLVRNDGTDSIAALTPPPMSSAVAHEYVTEPFYHLGLLFESEQQRRDKAIRYEVVRPGLKAVGGGRLNEVFYLPELRDSPQLHPVPTEDEASVANVLCAPETIEPPHSSTTLPVISTAEMDRMWKERAVAEDAYRARIEAYEPIVSFAPAWTSRAESAPR
jgi:hypothetical protein